MHELAFQEQKQEIESVAQRAGREDCRVHVRGGGGAEEIDDELDRAVDPFGGARRRAEWRSPPRSGWRGWCAPTCARNRSRAARPPCRSTARGTYRQGTAAEQDRPPGTTRLGTR